MAGRKRTGTLVPTGAGFSARFAGGKLIPLYTTDRTLAEARLRELATNGTQPEPGAVTFREAAAKVCDALEKRGMATIDERRSRLARYVFPHIGNLKVTEIKPSAITDVLARAVETGGLKRDTLHHLHTDIHTVFAALVKDDTLSSNPARAEKIDMPQTRRDRRRRVLLTDSEFSQFVAYHLGPPAPLRRRVGESRYQYAQKVANHATTLRSRRQLALMAIVSRCFGGLRPSDIHAWTWEDVDTLTWQWADAPRAKTEHAAELEGEDPAPRERLELPSPVAAFLAEWWRLHGGPTTGLVFPEQKHSYARDLRRALLEAGITRAELHTDTTKTRATDFYSFRRAYNTALARLTSTGQFTTQMAMKSAGHKNITTHMRYVVPDVIPIPAAALPVLELPSGAGAPTDAPSDPTRQASTPSPAPTADADLDFEAALAQFESEHTPD